MSNPFEIKQYYICESIYNSSCETIKPSRINKERDNEFTVTGPFNLTEIQEYIFNETSKLIINIQLVHRCDESGIDLNKNKDGTFATGCSSTFQNFSTEYLKNLKQNINNGDSYKSQIGSGLNPFISFAYTDSYIKSKTTPNDWKPLCQRYADIGQMLKDFSDILSSISNSSQKTTFSDKYNEILSLYKKNNQIRQNLEAKLDIITNSRMYKDSKEFLDSTIYISVLWTILATTLLFYVFKKI
jgi:hypothetical protein